MRLAIIGAGAVGGVIAGYLAATGRHQVSVLARGTHLDAIRAKGLTVESRGRILHSHPPASDEPAELGQQDVLVLTVKAHSLPLLAPRLAPLIGPETIIVSAQNGIPWWYFHGQDGPDGDTPFERVDPAGTTWRALGPERVLGCVIYLPASIEAPGVVHHDGVLRLVLGAPHPDAHHAPLAAIAEALNEAGVEARVTGRIRHALWSKLLLNSATATLSVLTGATIGQLQSGAGLRQIRVRLMREALATAQAWGIDLDDETDAMVAAAGGNAAQHKPSMLQDYEARRPLELDAIVAAVIDLARRREVPVPTIELLWSILVVKLAAESYPGLSSLP
jgi:2-dehydropantoate 2-reductase